MSFGGNMTFERWLKDSLVEGKKEYVLSRDALEVLLKMAWNAGAKGEQASARANIAEEERERKYGSL